MLEGIQFMANVKKEDRVDGTEILKLNHLGLGLRTIGDLLGCHAATVAVRLKELGVEVVDTRKNFMGDVYNSLTDDEKEWLVDTLYNSGKSVKSFISEVIKEAFKNAPKASAPVTSPLPPMAVQQDISSRQRALEELLKEVRTTDVVVTRTFMDEHEEPVMEVVPETKSLFTVE